ncbi:hypothetical protein [cf. Phormidesmis sp. LEGE 11477]|uniref:hypothetical protein n=1 Tax=cf. Phormidesmis sp. LEGE 11477 TaxID=1828680 RepID=UPI00188294AE|nr:hypothetical protein [cf. Phormidesmis sp. LEGE 11477]MBE9063163.1 hypothetical protein [cf. Phormidesmis sp. LEGE 11477]
MRFGLEVIRLWIRTQPPQQWSVGREYRRLLKIKFDKLGWNFGAPRQILEFPKENADLQILNERPKVSTI